MPSEDVLLKALHTCKYKEESAIAKLVEDVMGKVADIDEIKAFRLQEIENNRDIEEEIASDAARATVLSNSKQSTIPMSDSGK